MTWVALAAGSVGPRGREALAAGALLVFWLAGLNGAPLFDVDEGAFAQATREMLASNDFGHTTLNGADRFDKPILVYWLQAASMALLGAHEWSARLPSALCAWVWCLLLARLTGELGGDRQAQTLAAVLGAGALGPMLIGRAATADALLHALLLASMLQLWRYLRDGTSRDLNFAALWIGLALLTKGPVGLVVPAGVWLAWSTWTGSLTRWRVLLRERRALLVLILVAMPWYAWALWRHGQAFVDGFWLRHNLERFSGTLEGHGGAWYYHLLALPLLLLPWAPLWLSQARRYWQQRSEPGMRFLMAWLAFVLMFFSLAGTKLPHYALYAAAASIVMLALQTPALTSNWMPCAVAIPAAALVSLWALSPAVVQALGTSLPTLNPANGFAPDLLPEAPGPAAVVLVLLLLAVLCLPSWARRWGISPAQRIGTIVAVQATVVVLGLLPWWGAVLQGPVRDLGRYAATREHALVQWGVHQPSFAFYAGRVAPRREPGPGEWALTACSRASHARDWQPLIVERRQTWCLVARP